MPGLKRNKVLWASGIHPFNSPLPEIQNGKILFAIINNETATRENMVSRQYIRSGYFLKQKSSLRIKTAFLSGRSSEHRSAGL